MEDGLDVGLGVLAVQLAVLIEFALLLSEELNDLHADDIFLDEGV